ncbi:hypothetical protein MNBD_BACTEROID04-1013 [hydrothermal vent metagenome]|uniref:Uncharacterized protein n=1 Tax=hydrothermal vent metagenome TaxID=652676 RepID=A0A3B0TL34_9ZZZZ
MTIKKKTAKRKTTKKKSSNGLGLVALAAATAAGVYFLYGSKNATKNRKNVKGWTLKAKGEVLEKMEKMKSIDEANYKRIVDTVAKKYKKLKTVNTKEAEALASELKKQWKEISKEAGKKPAKKAVKKKKK